jgi:hypothetical protein
MLLIWFSDAGSQGQSLDSHDHVTGSMYISNTYGSEDYVTDSIGASTLHCRFYQSPMVSTGIQGAGVPLRGDCAHCGFTTTLWPALANTGLGESIFSEFEPNWGVPSLSGNFTTIEEGMTQWQVVLFHRPDTTCT